MITIFKIGLFIGLVIFIVSNLNIFNKKDDEDNDKDNDDDSYNNMMFI